MNELVLIDGIARDLNAIEQDLWIRLLNGSLKASNPFHTGVLGTINGDFPELRTVVIRKINAAQKEIRFHTDIRSPKAKLLQDNPRISWLFYSEKNRMQYRMKGIATLNYKNEKTLEAWQCTSLNSRKCYLTTIAPGAEIHSPTESFPLWSQANHCGIEETEIAYSNFTVVETKIQEIDWLYLNHAGHRRVHINYAQDGFKAQWINP